MPKLLLTIALLPLAAFGWAPATHRSSPGWTRRLAVDGPVEAELVDLATSRPVDGDAFTCSIPDFGTICKDDESCEVGSVTKEAFEEWLSNQSDQLTADAELRGERTFRYSSATDMVSVDFFSDDGTIQTISWPWDPVFYALYDWDMMCDAEPAMEMEMIVN